MDETRRPVIYLDLEDILKVNRRVILRTGGFVPGAGVPRDRGSLQYLLEAAQGRIYGRQLYRTLACKAALYAFHIITRHVFVDGNKRTGMICALHFLRLNGCAINECLQESEIVRVALNIANGSMGLSDVTGWIEANLH